MTVLYQRFHSVYRHQVRQKLGKQESEMTAKEVLDLLFDDEGDYVVYHQSNPYKSKTTIGQRLNRFWVVPIWLLCYPFVYVITGDGSINPNTKFAKFLSKLTGL